MCTTSRARGSCSASSVSRPRVQARLFRRPVGFFRVYRAAGGAPSGGFFPPAQLFGSRSIVSPAGFFFRSSRSWRVTARLRSAAEAGSSGSASPRSNATWRCRFLGVFSVLFRPRAKVVGNPVLRRRRSCPVHRGWRASFAAELSVDVRLGRETHPGFRFPLFAAGLGGASVPVTGVVRSSQSRTRQRDSRRSSGCVAGTRRRAVPRPVGRCFRIAAKRPAADRVRVQGRCGSQSSAAERLLLVPGTT